MDRRKLLVAVVDDEDSVRKALQRLLRSAGMEVRTYASGCEFLRVADPRQLDCLVLDLHMPVMNGFEVQEQLVRTGASMPVVIITGHDKPEYRARARDCGVSAYLPKPIDDCVLLDAIANAIPR